jgi:ATP phosphoribosyltransferase regulatory subunit
VKTAAERYAALVRLVESRTVTRVNPPLLLPAGPYFDLAGEEFGRSLLLTTTNGGVEYCLRPDFTLPIAQSYLDEGLIGRPEAFTYLGTIFRQYDGQPVEHEQAGLELLGQPDASQALDQVLTFARWALAIYDVTAPGIRLGGVGLFEAFLEAAEVPPVWQSRIRHRFGHPAALQRLMERLADPVQRIGGHAPDGHETVTEIVTDAMLSAGLGRGTHPGEHGVAAAGISVDRRQCPDRARSHRAHLPRARLRFRGAALPGAQPRGGARSAVAPGGRDLRCQLLAPPRLLHRHRLRDDR